VETLPCRQWSAAPRLGFQCEVLDKYGGEACHAVETPQTAGIGPFVAGAIDLRGDGVLEQILRENDQVLVYRNGAEAWRSLPDWQIVDMALGDPNDDGRGEILLALWKTPDVSTVEPPATSGLLSHPFIIGYRGGSFRILWGGSAVAEPIHELELGDVDGDGTQELVVLEGALDSLQRTLSIWRWHGWGFSRLCQSRPGRYRHLTLLPDPMGSNPIIAVSSGP
jgi:hypothetical protein